MVARGQAVQSAVQGNEASSQEQTEDARSSSDEDDDESSDDQSAAAAEKGATEAGSGTTAARVTAVYPSSKRVTPARPGDAAPPPPDIATVPSMTTTVAGLDKKADRHRSEQQQTQDARSSGSQLTKTTDIAVAMNTMARRKRSNTGVDSSTTDSKRARTTRSTTVAG